jgi:hypothetical protein
VPLCPHCARANPDDALFCWYDGGALGAETADPKRLRFAAPFIFPSGRACWTFDEWALACRADWSAAVALHRAGALAAFLEGLGRLDLADRARDTMTFPDPDRSLDQFLGDLPARSLQPAKLALSFTEIDFGRLRVGQDVAGELNLINEGMRLLHGVVSSDVPWLAVGEGGARNKLFSALHEFALPIRVLGRALRAALKPQVGKLTISSSGGRAVVTVKVEAPPQTFAAGVLAGARTPRQLAEKARLAPRESARLFESGAVARWYHDNGWTYPVTGGSATGLAVVQQFFDALGISAPPRLELSESALEFAGEPGERLIHSLQIGANQKRPVYAVAQSDEPWLVVSGIDLDGNSAHIRLSVPSIPDRPGATLRATLSITGNSRQHFSVPVVLRIAGTPRESAQEDRTPVVRGELDWLPAGEEVAPSPALTSLLPAEEWLPAATRETPRPPTSPELRRDELLPATAKPAPPRPGRRTLWLVLVVLGALVVASLAGLLIARAVSSAKSSKTQTRPEDHGAIPAAEVRGRGGAPVGQAVQ